MSEEINIERQLGKNKIKSFILKIDLVPNETINYIDTVNKISAKFDRIEKKIRTNIIFNIKDGKPELNKNESLDYILVNDSNKTFVTFSPQLNSFWFETSHYKDNKCYKEIIPSIIDAITSSSNGLIAKRTGLRYINEFPCISLKNISKIFNPNISKNIIHMSSQDNISRVIAQEEFALENSKLRIQYGIPNKFYPAKIENYDLLLDIDSYSDSQKEISNCEEILSELNHLAYDKFKQIINPKYLDELK